MICDMTDKAFALPTEMLLCCIFHSLYPSVHTVMFCKQRVWIMNGSLFPDMTFSPKPFSLKCSSAPPSDFKGQFPPGIELFSTTKYIGPIPDLPWVCLCYSIWEHVSALGRIPSLASDGSTWGWGWGVHHLPGPGLPWEEELDLEADRAMWRIPAGPVKCPTGHVWYHLVWAKGEIT